MKRWIQKQYPNILISQYQILENITSYLGDLILKIHIDKAGNAKPESSSLVIAVFEAGTHFYPEDPEEII